MAIAAANIDPRTFKHRLRLEQRANQIEDFPDECETSEDWVGQCTIRGFLRPLRADEIISAQRVMAKVTHVLLCRWTDHLTSDKRFNYCDRVLNIAGVINVEECNKYAECLLVEDAS